MTCRRVFIDYVSIEFVNFSDWLIKFRKLTIPLDNLRVQLRFKPATNHLQLSQMYL